MPGQNSLQPGDAAPAFESCGVRIDALDFNRAVDALLERRGGPIHLCNAYTLSLAIHNPDFARLLNRGALNLADGTPLVLIARYLKIKQLDRRVYGPDLMSRCLDRGRSDGLRHFLYGGTAETLQALLAVIGERWPGTQIVGCEAPPFRPLSDDEIAASLRSMERSRADVVWVGLGTPKQDQIVDRLATQGGAAYVAVGAAFDFIAGTKRQAPRWMRDRGLEWLFRLAAEPRRLWKRYLIGNTVFVWANLRRPPVRLTRDDARPEQREGIRD